MIREALLYCFLFTVLCQREFYWNMLSKPELNRNIEAENLKCYITYAHLFFAFWLQEKKKKLIQSSINKKNNSFSPLV